MENIQELTQDIINGKLINAEEAMALLRHPDAEELYAAANKVRQACCGSEMNYCSIINARSGRCSEDCKWCSQSHAHQCGVQEYRLVDDQEAVDMAVDNESKGVHRFSIVTSGRTVTDKQLDEFIEILRKIRQKSGITLCASMGLLNKEQLQRLKNEGIEHYHCNIETAPSKFPELCTTHSLEDKLRTIRWAKEVGIDVCSGGIIGMGESEEQRVEMALFLRDLGITSIPINSLMPIKGTKLGETPLLDNETIFRTMAMFRLVNPKAHIRMAGGRANYYTQQEVALRAGVNASIVGDMLTTVGAKTIDDDMRNLVLDKNHQI